ncbi:uncharacterized protein MYCFIDRAFT_172634 [Pseudocercospora fijiensis CIRAD86]|uniref:Uncharacterized protein n=1 Tax=Pseudocercospora fijiensis (strain CIRAD86) TaxID=383855 RepID=M3A790_PSEFD|nr:uncharacterized protein MYCFIDRAFT_172634 [Pseudocercospora fijiensis CIRAD86]EME86954.1 hypothetical protein MYCFIDRAFT_172634 [Pseudocercospora fijiensis CIRAD86]
MKRQALVVDTFQSMVGLLTRIHSTFPVSSHATILTTALFTCTIREFSKQTRELSTLGPVAFALQCLKYSQRTTDEDEIVWRVLRCVNSCDSLAKSPWVRYVEPVQMASARKELWKNITTLPDHNMEKEGSGQLTFTYTTCLTRFPEPRSLLESASSQYQHALRFSRPPDAASPFADDQYEDGSCGSKHLQSYHRREHVSTEQAIYDIGSASGGYHCANYAIIYPGNVAKTTANNQGPDQPLKNESSESDPFVFEGRVSEARLAELYLMGAPRNSARHNATGVSIDAASMLQRHAPTSVQLYFANGLAHHNHRCLIHLTRLIVGAFLVHDLLHLNAPCCTSKIQVDIKGTDLKIPYCLPSNLTFMLPSSGMRSTMPFVFYQNVFVHASASTFHCDSLALPVTGNGQGASRSAFHIKHLTIQDQFMPPIEPNQSPKMFSKTLNGSNKLQKQVALYVSVEEQQNPSMATSPDPDRKPRGYIPTPIQNAITKLRTRAKSIGKMVRRVKLALRRRNTGSDTKGSVPVHSDCSSSLTPPTPYPHRQQIDSYFDIDESPDEISNVSHSTAQYMTLDSDSSGEELDPSPPGLHVTNFSPADEQAAVNAHFSRAAGLGDGQCVEARSDGYRQDSANVQLRLFAQRVD